MRIKHCYFTDQKHKTEQSHNNDRQSHNNALWNTALREIVNKLFKSSNQKRNDTKTNEFVRIMLSLTAYQGY